MINNTTYNFNKPFLNLAKEPFFNNAGEAIKLGEALAPVIAGHNRGDALKLFGWALSLFKNEDLTLDKSDHATLKEFIKASDQMNVLLKAQLLEVLEK